MEGSHQTAPVKSQLRYRQRGGDYRHGCQKEPIRKWERQQLLQLLGGYFCRRGSDKQQMRLGPVPGGRVGKWHLFCWKWCCCGRDAGFCVVQGQAQPGLPLCSGMSLLLLLLLLQSVVCATSASHRVLRSP